MRNLAKSFTCEPRPHNSRALAKDAFILKVADIKNSIMLDFETGFLYFGRSLVYPNKGLTQGNPFAPGVCNVVCCYLEYEKTRLVPSISPPCKIINLLMRWVDDIYGINCFLIPEAMCDTDEFGPVRKRRRIDNSSSMFPSYIDIANDQLIEKFVGIYRGRYELRRKSKSTVPTFSLKIEDPSVFVGFAKGN